MAQYDFTFAPRVNLLLENLETIRDALKICLGGELREETKRFAVWLKSKLLGCLPELQSWRFLVSDDCLEIHPNQQWEVLGKDEVGIRIHISLVEVDRSDILDSGAGLHVPAKWSKSEEFVKELVNRLPENLRDLLWHETDWPLWKYIYLKDYLHAPLDLAPYLDEIIDLTTRLASISPEVDDILKKLSKPSKHAKR